MWHGSLAKTLAVDPRDLYLEDRSSSLGTDTRFDVLGPGTEREVVGALWFDADAADRLGLLCFLADRVYNAVLSELRRAGSGGNDETRVRMALGSREHEFQRLEEMDLETLRALAAAVR